MRSSLENLWSRRHLLSVLIRSNLKRQNKNSALGYLWWLLDPILMTGVYYIVVVVLFQRGGSNQPYILFLMCGLLVWKAFSTSVGQSVESIRAQTSIIKAISFPKAVLPLSLVFSNTVHFLFALLVAVGLGVWYGHEYGTWLNIYYFMLPVVVGLQVMFTMGVVLIISTLGLFFRDTTNIIGHLLRMWYFLSPGLYSIDRVPESLQPVFRLNPFCELMTSYRDIIMWGRMPSWFDLGYAFGIGLVSLLTGYLVFRRYEGRFVQRL
jgi:ABC-type polysaccharide/polyol phosphate export permease